MNKLLAVATLVVLGAAVGASHAAERPKPRPASATSYSVGVSKVVPLGGGDYDQATIGKWAQAAANAVGYAVGYAANEVYNHHLTCLIGPKDPVPKDPEPTDPTPTDPTPPTEPTTPGGRRAPLATTDVLFDVAQR